MPKQSSLFRAAKFIFAIFVLVFPSHDSLTIGFSIPTNVLPTYQTRSSQSTSIVNSRSHRSNVVVYSNVDNNQQDTNDQSNQTTLKAPTPTIINKNDDSTSLIFDRITAELTQSYECLSTILKFTFMDSSTSSVSAEEIVKLCDEIDQETERLVQSKNNNEQQLIVDNLELRKLSLEVSRYQLLTKLMKKDYSAYVATASFLSPSRIDRIDLPNVQDVPFNDIMPSMSKNDDSSDNLVEDCTLDEKTFNDSILDQILLKIFRNLVEKNTNGVTSSKDGIDGLLEQGRTFMLQPNQTPEAQHEMVKDTLGGLMTPVLPPFYRIFMAGIVPKLGVESLDGKQFGPWFYAPWLTSIVTPTFFAFLVGPSRPNRRKDGERGGLVVEKCKFLQESNCKGLCLHQCKSPAQQFFKEELGLDLTVSPNFATQECQWSFGEKPLPPDEDPSFPRGCIVGCGSRSEIANRRGAPACS